LFHDGNSTSLSWAFIILVIALSKPVANACIIASRFFRVASTSDDPIECFTSMHLDVGYGLIIYPRFYVDNNFEVWLSDYCHSCLLSITGTGPLTDSGWTPYCRKYPPTIWPQPATNRLNRLVALIPRRNAVVTPWGILSTTRIRL
jgi:hypothetical protein